MDNNTWKSISPFSLIIHYHDMAIQSLNVSFMLRVAGRSGPRMMTLLITIFINQAQTVNLQYCLSESEVIG